MPAVLGMYGFGARNVTRERLIVTAGTWTYSTSTLPADSPSTTSISGSAGAAFRAPWYNDATGGQFEPSTGALWFHARYYTALNTGTNNALRLGVARNGTEYVTISAENSTNKLVLRVAGTVRATAASAAFSLSTWARIHVHIAGASTGSVISVYLNGDVNTPVLTYTLIGADQTALSGVGAPNEFAATMKGGSGDLVDDMVAWDPAAAGFPGIQYFVSCGIAEQLFTGNGPETGWSGSYTDIDERPANDTDKISATSVGLESSFTKAAIGEPNVFAAKVLARVTRSGTSAGTHLDLKINDGTNHQAITVSAPGDGDVQGIFEVAPDGLAWSPVKYDATRIAFVAAT